MKNIFTRQHICSTTFMEDDLVHLTGPEIKKWFDEIKHIDSIIHTIYESHLPAISQNRNKLPQQLIDRCNNLLAQSGNTFTYDLNNLEVFHGYSFYNLPDGGNMRQITNNPEAYYGIAKASKYGEIHRHFHSDAFNLILEGQGVFTGDISEKDRFRNFYHGMQLVPGTELEIEIGMAHGHLVRKGCDMWIFAYQHCGFGTGLSCEGDFHKIPKYDISQFGSLYQ